MIALPDVAHTVAYIGLGSNLGDCAGHLQQAVERLCHVQGVSAVFASPVYACAAHVLPGQSPQPDFLNAVCRVRTTLEASDLLGELIAIEHALGRDRQAPRWSARPIDLDVILFGDERVESESLTIPHPRLGDRLFWLRPLLDLMPSLRLPDGTPISSLAGFVRDDSLRLTDIVLSACPDRA